MRLLVVEDERRLARSLANGLAAEGFTVDLAHDGVTGLHEATEHAYDLIVLDIMLPGMNGYRVCAELRAAGSQVPILMLTAKDGEYDEAEGLDTGADDYLTKPFSYVVLLARIRALLRRHTRGAVPEISLGDLRVDPGARTVHRGDVAIELTAKELRSWSTWRSTPAGWCRRRRSSRTSGTSRTRAIPTSSRSTSARCAARWTRRSAAGPSRPCAGRATGSAGTAAAEMRLFSSVRARATLAATLVVAVALVVAGWLVLSTLRANLTDQADLQAEVAARQVASQVAVGTPVTGLRLPGSADHPVQVTADDGPVLAVSKDLRAISGTGSDQVSVTASPAAVASGRHGGRDDDDDGGGHGGDGDDDDDARPGRGQVSTDVDYRTGRATVGHTSADYRFAAVEATAPDGRTVTVYAGARLEMQAVSAATDVMLIGLPALLLVVAAMTWLVTRRALRPVEGIRAEMAAITSAGELGRRVPVPASRDEVARLAETTNQTLGALESSVERQRRFVADASHELRSPLASLRTQLEVAAQHPHLLDLHGTVHDVVRLQDLAADLLVLARLDAGEHPRRGRVDLGTLVQEELARRAKTDRIPVELSADPEAAFDVSGSGPRLTRAVRNLLDNAQHHATGAVRVALTTAHGRVSVRVTDDGPGVPEADRERIFERFVRLDDARSRDAGGSGLGLAIARTIARSHDGDLTVTDAPGGGAAFEITLPAA